MDFLQNSSLQVPETIRFGCGSRSELPQLVSQLGETACLVLGSRTCSRSEQYHSILDGLKNAGLGIRELALQTREPDVDDVNVTVERMKAQLESSPRPVLIGIGGGSALDLMKATAALVTNPADNGVIDYLEGVGAGRQITEPPLPMIAVPTTAGTGSEATRNAVISSRVEKFKVSLRSPLMVPDIVVVDPELMLNLRPDVTASAGMDALTQLIESYVSCRSTAATRPVSREGLRGGLDALIGAVEGRNPLPHRITLSRAALYSGVALANSGLGFAHGVAAALGIHGNVAHGLACAIMLPMAIELNREVAGERIAELAEPLGLSGSGTIQQSVDRILSAIRDTLRRLRIPTTLHEVGISPEQIPELVASSRGNSMRGNPRIVDDSELEQVLIAML